MAASIFAPFLLSRGKWCGLLLPALLLLTPSAFANDGRDRYRTAVPPLLYLFDEPLSMAAGYRVLPADAPGGADGQRAFRWAHPHAIALVRLAAYAVQQKLGGGRYPMAIFDLSAENGDTPVQFAPNTPPQGRHPGGSHDGGLNLDLGYYLTSLKGLHFSPDHAACSHHFKPRAEGGPPEDGYLCDGPPDRLDVARQALLLVEIFRINRDLFQRQLVAAIGMDLQISRVVLQKVQAWAQKGQYGASRELLGDMRRTFTADRWEGWAGSHHHHLHLRLADLPRVGPHLEAMETLLQRERQNDLVLWRTSSSSSRGKGPLRLRLASVELERAIEAELLEPCASPLSAQFRLGSQGEWVQHDPSYWPRLRAMLDLPAHPSPQETRESVEAEFRCKGMPAQTVVGALRLPAQDPRLAIAVEPLRIQPSYRRLGAQLLLGLSFPASYQHYISRVEFQVQRGGKGSASRPPAETYPVKGPAYQLRLPEGASRTNPLESIVAAITLSSRMTLRMPMYINDSGS
jgi:hypothetical protein